MAGTIKLANILVNFKSEGAKLLAKDLKSVQTNAQKMGKSMQKTGRNLTQFGQTMSRRVTLPLAAAGAGALKMSADFEQSMKRIQTLVGINADQLGEWRQKVLDLAPAVGIGPKELSDALFVVSSAGARGAEALEILEAAAKASAAGLGETSSIARSVTAAMQVYSEEGLTAAQATDILVATVREGNLEAESLSGSLGRVLGPAQAVGASFSDVGAFIATFTRAGGSAEEAATSLTAALSLVIKPAVETRAAMKEAGFSIEQFRAAIAEDGLESALRQMMDATEGNLDTIGEFIPNVRALRGVLNTAGAQGEEFAQISDNITNSQGILQRAFDETRGTVAQTFAEMKAQASVLAIAIGDMLAPHFSFLLKIIQDVMARFGELSPRVQGTAVAVGALAAAIGPVTIALGTLITTGGTLITALAAITAPVAAVIGILGSLAFTVGVVISNWQELKIQGALAWAALKEAIFGAISAILESMERLPLVGEKVKGLRAEFDAFAEESLANSGRKIAEMELELANSNTTMGEVSTSATNLRGELDSTADAATNVSNAAAEMETDMDAVKEAVAALAAEQERIPKLSKLMGKGFNASDKRASALRSAIEDLVDAGVDLTDTIPGLNMTLAELAAELDRVEAESRAAEEAQKDIEDAIKSARSAVESTVPEHVRLRDTLDDLKVALDAGAISQEEFEAATKAVQEQMQDSKDAIDGTSDAMATFRKLTDEAKTADEEFNEIQAQLKQLLDDSRISQEEYNDAIKQAEENLKDAKGASSDLGDGLKELASMFEKHVGPLPDAVNDVFSALDTLQNVIDPPEGGVIDKWSKWLGLLADVLTSFWDKAKEVLDNLGETSFFVSTQGQGFAWSNQGGSIDLSQPSFGGGGGDGPINTPADAFLDQIEKNTASLKEIGKGTQEMLGQLWASVRTWDTKSKLSEIAARASATNDLLMSIRDLLSGGGGNSDIVTNFEPRPGLQTAGGGASVTFGDVIINGNVSEPGDVAALLDGFAEIVDETLGRRRDDEDRLRGDVRIRR